MTSYYEKFSAGRLVLVGEGSRGLSTGHVADYTRALYDV